VSISILLSFLLPSFRLSLHSFTFTLPANKQYLLSFKIATSQQACVSACSHCNCRPFNKSSAFFLPAADRHQQRHKSQ
jgi:hypothetical protein